MIKQLVPALRMVLLLTVLTGFIYPGVVTGLCQVMFRNKANGSLVEKNGNVVGSRLLAQSFSRPEYFHPRPSAAGNGYDPLSSSGSNLGPTSQKLVDRVKASTEQFRKENPDYSGPIPADAVTASGSGLDPDISIGNALAQVQRVAQARKLNPENVEQLIQSHTQGRALGIFGEPAVNVLDLNLALDNGTAKP